MKIKAKSNGDVIDVSDEAANELIRAGIYDAVEETPTTEDSPPLMTENAKPMTTASMPTRAKRIK